jgi:hypothetical protein
MRQDERRKNAEYIASMCNELAVMAGANGFDFGSRLLRMSCVEFTEQQENLSPGKAGRQQP